MNTLPSSRRIVRPLLLALAMGVCSAVLVSTTPTVAATACRAEWGSLAKTRAPYSGKQVSNVRSGRHQCFDRLVIDVNRKGTGLPGYHVAYVATVTSDGSGAAVPLRGGARLRIVVKAPAYDAGGAATYRPANRRELVDVSGHQTFRQVAWAGSFEGRTTLGLGVRARLPMRAFVLDNADGGHRIVVDVAHRW